MPRKEYTEKRVPIYAPPSSDTYRTQRFLQRVADAINGPPAFKTEFITLSTNTNLTPDRLVVYLCNTGITVTLPSPGKVTAMNFYMKNVSNSNVTITSASGNVESSSNFVLLPKQSIQIGSDSTDYWVL